MSIIGHRLKAQSGFTIVELLIVIVVIAILASISVVAYTGIQNRANDSNMKSAASQVEKALRLYAVDNGTTITGGYGSTTAISGGKCADGSSGFFGVGAYTCTVEEVLVANRLLPNGFSASLPANIYFGTSTGGRSAMMLYSCGGNGKYALYWTLRNPSAADTASIDSVFTECSSNTMIRDTWGMRAGRIVQL